MRELDIIMETTLTASFCDPGLCQEASVHHHDEGLLCYLRLGRKCFYSWLHEPSSCVHEPGAWFLQGRVQDQVPSSRETGNRATGSSDTTGSESHATSPFISRSISKYNSCFLQYGQCLGLEMGAFYPFVRGLCFGGGVGVVVRGVIFILR